MPIYQFKCKCGNAEELICTFQKATTTKIDCSSCGKIMERQKVNAFRAGKEAYQMQAVLEDGSHIKGHFGKEAKRRRK